MMFSNTLMFVSSLWAMIHRSLINEWCCMKQTNKLQFRFMISNYREDGSARHKLLIGFWLLETRPPCASYDYVVDLLLSVLSAHPGFALLDVKKIISLCFLKKLTCVFMLPSSNFHLFAVSYLSDLSLSTLHTANMHAYAALWCYLYMFEHFRSMNLQCLCLQAFVHVQKAPVKLLFYPSSVNLSFLLWS